VAQQSFIENTAANRNRIPGDLWLVLPHRLFPKQRFGIRYVLTERRKWGETPSGCNNQWCASDMWVSHGSAAKYSSL